MNLLKALARTSSMTMISRVLGLVREVMNANLFGAGVAMDAFNVAFMLPNLFRRVFAEGAFSQAFVPILAEYKAQRGDDAAREFVAYVAGMLAFILFVFTTVCIVAAPVLVWLAASGFAHEPGKLSLTVALTRITFPYIFLISLSSLTGSILNTWNRFSIPAFTPAFLNIAMIGGGYLLSPYFDQPIIALAVSVLIGGLLQLGFQLPYLWQIKMLARPRLQFDYPDVGRVMRQMGPAIFGVSVTQVSLLLNRTFASYLSDGSVSWIGYADRLMELPAGVLGVALGTILLPGLAKLKASGQEEEYSAMLDWGLRLCMLLALPATIALAVIAQPVIASLYLGGAFHVKDVVMTERSLTAYSVGLLGLIVVKVLAPAYYARQDIKTPVKIGLATLLVTQLLNLALIWHFNVAGLALALGLGACFNAGLLLTGLLRRGVYRPLAGWGVFTRKLLIAVGSMAVVLWLCRVGLGGWLTDARLLRLGKLAVLVSAGATTYFAALYLQGFRPRDFSRRAVQ